MTRWLVLAAALTMVAFAGSLFVYFAQYEQLPHWIATHWDIYGEPDGWTAKEDALTIFLLMPSIMAGIVALTLVLPWLSPKGYEVGPFRETFAYIMALTVALMGYLHVIIIWGGLHPEESIIRWMVGGIFLFFALLGNVLGRVRRNFWMGIRTPWTLASESVWDRTHRLSAWLFVITGILGFVSVLVGVPLAVCFAGLIVAALIPVVYSLVLYKRLEKQGKI